MPKPGIRTKKTRTLMDVPLRQKGAVEAAIHYAAKSVPFEVRDTFLETAWTDPLLMPPVKLAPLPQVRRKGFRLALRRFCYFVLNRT